MGHTYWSGQMGCLGPPALAALGSRLILRGRAGRALQPGLRPCCPHRQREWLRSRRLSTPVLDTTPRGAQAQRTSAWFQAELVSAQPGRAGFPQGWPAEGGHASKQGGQPGSQGKALPTLTHPAGFPSSLGARSSTVGSACTPPEGGRALQVGPWPGGGCGWAAGHMHGWLAGTQAGNGAASHTRDRFGFESSSAPCGLCDMSK